MDSKFLIITIFLCISFAHYSWGMLDDGVEVCYSFRPDVPGMQDMSIKMNNSFFYSVTVKRMVSEFKTYRYATVTLKALREDRPFQGFILRAVEVPAIRGPMELEPLPIGSFHPAPECELLSCFRGLNNAIIHHDQGPKVKATVDWSPPVYRGKTPGRVVFVATVIESEKKYWYGVASSPIKI